MSPIRILVFRIVLVFAGVVAAVVLLEAGMRAAGWVVEQARVRSNLKRIQGGGQVRVLCLGESTTLGDPLHLRYPDALQEVLDAQLGEGFASVINGGQYGILTGRILAELPSNLDHHQPEIVVTMIGINDAGRTHAWGTVIWPGRDRWYGQLRIYKLYRVLRVSLARRLLGEADIDRMAVAESITNVEPSNPLDGLAEELVEHYQHGMDDATDERLMEVDAWIRDGRFEEAESELLEIIREHPESVAPHIQLSHLYTRLGRLEEAHEVMLRRQATLAQPAMAVLETLAHSNANLGRHDRAIEIFLDLRRNYAAADDFHAQIHFAKQMAMVYEDAGRLDEAEACYLEVVERLSPGNDTHYDELVAFYRRHGRTAEAERATDIQRRIREEYVNPETRRNYLELRAVLEESGVMHVAVQYPGRPIENLKRLLDFDPRPVYVDNSFFAELVERNGYETYFIDRFAGDFGHMSSLGHELLAENIARAIVEDYLGRPFDDDWRAPGEGPAAAFEAAWGSRPR